MQVFRPRREEAVLLRSLTGLPPRVMGAATREGRAAVLTQVIQSRPADLLAGDVGKEAEPSRLVSGRAGWARGSASLGEG